MLLWHHHTGHWIVYSYGSESFNFAQPHFFNILFSYNRGWFVYTPVALLSMAGLFGLWKRNCSMFFWISGFLLIFIYIMSSWWLWYYASKSGQRVFIDIYVIIAFLIFCLYEINKNKVFRKILSVVFILLIALNLLQFYQHARFVFPGQDITRQIYWDSFFSLSPKAKVYLPDNAIVATKDMATDMENDQGWINFGTTRNDRAYSGKRSSLINAGAQYSVGIDKPLDSNFTTNNRIIKVSAMIYPVAVRPLSSLVIDFETDGKSVSYNPFYFANEAKADHWTNIEFAVYVPDNLPGNATVKVYFYHNPGSGDLFIDDLKVDFLSLREDDKSRHIEGIPVPCK